MSIFAKHHNRTCATAFCAMIAATLALFALSGCQGASVQPGGDSRCVVAHVIDGDTVICEGTRDRVRLVGIDAPEAAHDGRPAECHATDAREALRQLVHGRAVSMELDPSQDDRDRYGRRLRYLATDRTPDVGRALLSTGDALPYRAARHPRRTAYEDAARAARASKNGIWQFCVSVPGKKSATN